MGNQSEAERDELEEEGEGKDGPVCVKEDQLGLLRM